MRKIFLTGILGLFAANPAIAQDKSPIILELFTSQSCSSCPPADRVLGELAKEENIIALSCHVTYWNHLHWKDTLSQDFCTQRQRQYVRALQSRGPYTPQIVINGQHELVGSQGRKIQKIIEKEKNTVQSVDIRKKDGQLAINLPQVKQGEYVVTLLTYGPNHTQSIPSGENRGRNISYTNPVTDIEVLGSWDGSAQSLSQDISKYDGKQSYVILAHKNNRSVGQIIVAGQLDK